MKSHHFITISLIISSRLETNSKRNKNKIIETIVILSKIDKIETKALKKRLLSNICKVLTLLKNSKK
jgi:hypothetical protein